VGEAMVTFYLFFCPIKLFEKYPENLHISPQISVFSSYFLLNLSIFLCDFQNFGLAGLFI
jgi:hypothetical protein